MALPQVFLDTYGLLAVTNRAEAHYALAIQLVAEWESARRPRVVTEWVLAEFLANAARPPLRSLAVQAVHLFRQQPEVTIIPASSSDWQLGFELYESRPDKSWSLVDCISILTCQKLGIAEVFTGDRHFEQAGLTILLAGAP